jgi:photosystem II stability/assembly factor-like uncharacterized protein
MKFKFYSLCLLLSLLLMISVAFSQEPDELIVAPEVLFNGAPPQDMAFRPGRILDENTIWFCARHSGLFIDDETIVFRSIDGGKTFTHNATGIPGFAAQMDAFDADTAVVATADGYIYRTTDGGATWTDVYSYMISETTPGWFDGCRVVGGSMAVAFGDMEPNGNMQFVRTEDKGETWNVVEGIDFLGAAYGYYTWGLASSAVDGSIWCAATNMDYDSSFVFRSYNTGLTWDSYKIPTDVIPNYPRSIAFSDDNHGLIAARGGYLIKSENGGETWAATNNPDTSGSSYPNGVTAIPGTDIIVALDDIGVYYTPDLGDTWTKLVVPDTTSTDYFVSGEFLHPDFGYVFTDNGLVLRFKNQVTALPDNPDELIPLTMQLQQNYPNPFNPSTTIEFTLSRAEDVNLSIYNIQGMKIATLVSDRMNQGTHSVQFDGSGLASGVYYYQLSAGNMKNVKKMVLVK